MRWMKLVFMGSPEFALPALRCLCASPWEVLAVFTSPDKARGRGMEMSPTPVGLEAERQGIPVHKYASLRKDDAPFSVLYGLHPDFIVVVAYGKILPREILGVPRRGCVNIHPSLLPRHRGPAPIPAALLAGDEVTGVTTMFMDEGLDTGPILMQCREAILPEDNAQTLAVRLADTGADLLIRTLEGLERGDLRPTPQDSAQATHSQMLKKGDGQIDWTAPAAAIAGKVRAYTPWPSAFTTFHGKRLKILEGRALDESPGGAMPGTVLRVRVRGIDIACGTGVFQATTVKLEGKNACPVAIFLSGHKIMAGELWT